MELDPWRCPGPLAVTGGRRVRGGLQEASGHLGGRSLSHLCPAWWDGREGYFFSSPLHRMLSDSTPATCGSPWRQSCFYPAIFMWPVCALSCPQAQAGLEGPADGALRCNGTPSQVMGPVGSAPRRSPDTGDSLHPRFQLLPNVAIGTPPPALCPQSSLWSLHFIHP